MGKNKYICRDGYVCVYIENKDEVMLVDYDDWKKMCDKKWLVNDKGYAYCRDNGKRVTAHRDIMNPDHTLVVDHINNEKLDNRKENLRNCTLQENNLNRPVQKNNTSGTPGVTYVKKTGKWKVEICYYGQYKYLGTFEDYDEAVSVRKAAEKKYFKITA